MIYVLKVYNIAAYKRTNRKIFVVQILPKDLNKCCAEFKKTFIVKNKLIQNKKKQETREYIKIYIYIHINLIRKTNVSLLIVKFCARERNQKWSKIVKFKSIVSTSKERWKNIYNLTYFYHKVYQRGKANKEIRKHIEYIYT